MPADVMDRLRAYREPLDAAIADAVLVRDGGDSHALSVSDLFAVVDTPRHRAHWRAGGAVATAAAVLVAVIGLSGRTRTSRTTTAPGAPPPSARLLLDSPGWRMIRADERAGGGEVTFADGARQLELHWTNGGGARA